MENPPEPAIMRFIGEHTGTANSSGMDVILRAGD